MNLEQDVTFIPGLAARCLFQLSFPLGFKLLKRRKALSVWVLPLALWAVAHEGNMMIEDLKIGIAWHRDLTVRHHSLDILNGLAIHTDQVVVSANESIIPHHFRRGAYLLNETYLGELLERLVNGT